MHFSSGLSDFSIASASVFIHKMLQLMLAKLPPIVILKYLHNISHSKVKKDKVAEELNVQILVFVFERQG